MSISNPLVWAIEGHCVANCGDGSSSSTQSESSGNSYVSSPAPYQDPERERWLELERIKGREAEKARRQAEARASELEAQRQMLEAQRQGRLEWEKSKDETLRSLKSSAQSGASLELKSSQDRPHRLQEDYHKTLEVNEVPSPVLKKAQAPKAMSSKGSETKFFKRWRELHPLLKHADLVMEGIRQGAIKAGEKMKEMGSEEAKEHFMETFPLIKQAQELYEKYKGPWEDYYQEVKDLYEKIGGAHKETTTGLFEHMHEGVRELASPTVGGSTEEKMEAWTKSRGEAYEKMAHEKIGEKTKVKDLLEKTLGGEEREEVTEGDGNMVPIEGLKSYAKQRQEALNQQR